MAARTTPYITTWVAAACAAVAALFLLAPAEAPTWGLAIFVVAVAIAERTQLTVHLERLRIFQTLIDTAVVVGLLLLPLAYVPLGAGVGMAIATATRGADTRKVVFNSAMVVATTSVAGVVLALTPDIGPSIAGEPALGAIIGMSAYIGLNVVAMAGLARRLGGPDALATFRTQLPVTVGTSFGTTAAGVILAALWVTYPELVILLAAPLAAVYLAARGALRSAELASTMRSERDRLTRVVDGASDGIVLLDRDGTVQIWNAGMERLTGLPGARVVGRPVERVLTESVREGAAPVRGRWLVDDAHAGPSRRELEARLRHVDGTLRAVHETHSLVFDERGRCTGDVVVIRDVSRQRELERLRGDFVARVSHELRTPLTPIRGFASVLLRRGDQLDPVQRRDALERIVERADHLSEVVEDLLLVTRLDQRDLDDLVHPVPTTLTPVLEEAIAAIGEREPGRTISLHVAPQTGEALADPDRTRRIVVSLLDNACRYSPPDTPVEVVLDQRGDDVRVRVIDHGAGIPRDKHEVIFQQFHRLEDPLTMRTGGVGLGLFIGRRLAETMHGSLELEKGHAGPGSEFVLRLPSAEPVSDAAAPGAAS